MKALQGVFALDQGAARMQQFTQHFLERICEMGRDVKSHVARVGCTASVRGRQVCPLKLDQILAKCRFEASAQYQYF